tara:strand:- start:586 stop:1332 length:747 start_codon:yes stop_codon:yes gene_type:complete
VKIIGEAAKTSFYYKKDFRNLPNWDLIYKVKCKSTEIELTNYLNKSIVKVDKPIAIISKEQFSGVGQHGRKWLSPLGGIWLSAALPIFNDKFLPEIFPLSIANQLCKMFLEKSIKVDLKWPNDIFYGSQKIIGFLPKVITRGSKILYVRIGIGMNLNNRTPKEGISLSTVLNQKKICEYKWTSNILKVICHSVYSNTRKIEIIEEANRFLNKSHLPKGYDSSIWSIMHIDWNGKLIIVNNNDERILKL